MRSWIVSLAALTIAAGAALLSAPAHAGTTVVMVFGSDPSPAFGSVEVGQSPTRTFTLSNTSPSATGAITVKLTPSGVFTIPAGGDKCTGTALGPKKTCTVTVRYTPGGEGANDTATLTASAKKPGAQSATLALSGSSPASLSGGCQLLDGKTNFNGNLESDFNAGEVLTLTADSVGPGAGLRVLLPGTVPPRGEDGFVTVGGATPGNSVSYTFPVTGIYTVQVIGLVSSASCARP